MTKHNEQLAQIKTAAVVPDTATTDRRPAAVYLARLTSEHSRRAMYNALQRCWHVIFNESPDPLTLPWHKIRYEHSAAIRAQLQLAGYGVATVNQSLAALRGVLRESFRLGLIDAESYHRAADVADVKTTPQPAGRALNEVEIKAMLTSCQDGTPTGARDLALVALALGAGLRRSELVALDLADLEPDGGLLVRGKGSKVRRLYLVNGTKRAVDAWLAIRGTVPGPVFCRIGKGDRLHQDQRLTAQAVWHVLEHRGQVAGVQVRPHDLRRTCLTMLLAGGVDVLTVSDLAGHSDPRTTKRYDRRGDVVRRQALESLRLPV